MSDLRTCIAAAISAAWSELTIDESWEDGLLVLVDAVIRELGLKKTLETGEIVDRDGGIFIQYGRFRYITDWKADDE
jgi:hypothetical protein